MAELSKILIEKEGVETEYNFKDTTARANVETAKTEIAQTYVKELTASGQTITFTKGDDTQSTITTQDTTYTAVTQEADGLMAADDKRKLDNIEEEAQKNTITGVKGSAETDLRTGDIIISPSDLGLGNVENKSSEEIRDELTKENVTEALGYTPPQTDTTYGTMTGATSSAAGKSGLVPAPAAGKQGTFLRGDGTWNSPTNTTYSAGTGLALSGTTFSLASGVATAATVGPTENVTGTEGTKVTIPQVTVDTHGRVTGLTARTYTSKNTTYGTMGAASSSAAGTSGLVPAPAKGAQASFLRGDATWAAIPTGVKGSAEDSYRTGNVNITKTNIGLANVENKSSATIRGELTASNVTTALGTTPVSRATADASGNTITSTYAKLASPSLTGTPKAPTAAAGTNTTQIATTAFVQTAANARQKAITVSDSAPSSSSGSNGDIWIEY